MNGLGKAYLAVMVAEIVISAIATNVVDYNKARKAKKNKQKLEDEKEGVVWTIEACDVVEIYRNCEVV